MESEEKLDQVFARRISFPDKNSSESRRNSGVAGTLLLFELETLSIGSEAAPLWGLHGPFQLF